MINSLLHRSAVATRTAGKWFSSFTAVLILLIAAVLGLVVAGFNLISTEQSELSSVRDTTRQMRLARQASMEADDAVLRALVLKDMRGTMVDFGEAVDKIKSHKNSDFPKSVTDHSDPDNPVQITGAEAIVRLLKWWQQVQDQMRLGNWDEAAGLYERTKIHLHLIEMVASYYAELQVIEDTFLAKQKHVEWLTSIVLLLQILTGLAFVLAFLYAFRRNFNESRARQIAVVSADATRIQVERLFGMADMLQSASDYAEANAVLKSASFYLLEGMSGALYVFNNSRDRLVLSTTWDCEDDDSIVETIGLNQCWALRRGKPHLNYPSSRKLCCEHHAGRNYTLELPMVARGEILGLLQVHASGDDAEARLAGIQPIAAAIADAMSLALANIGLREKLRSQALRDPLTGLYNRRYMEDTLQRFVRLAEREKRDCSVIMIDLDHFKRLNDQYGHAKGDAVLRDAAAAIVNQMRETDVACRYGGEELIVLLPECGLEMAAAKAENIRFCIEALSEPNGATVSASLGVASMPGTAISAKDLVASADAALYLAKQGGRNRVVRAKPRGAVIEAAATNPAADIAQVQFPFLEAAE